MSKPLPKYKSNFRAFKIATVTVIPDGPDGGSEPDGAILVPENTDFASVTVNQAFVVKYAPETGNYYVVQKGHAFILTQAVFEGAYFENNAQ
jgi:hypothetical protein